MDSFSQLSESTIQEKGVSFKYDPNFTTPFDFWLTILSLFYSIPAMLIIANLAKECYQKSTGSFFKLMLVFSINDMLCYLSALFCIRIPYMGIVRLENFQTGIVPSFLYYSLFTTSYYQVAGCILIGLNRVTVFVFPEDYEKYWKKYLLLSLAVIFCGVQALTISNLLTGAEYIEIGPSIYIITSLSEEESYYGFQMVVVYLVTCPIAFAMNLITFINLRKFTYNGQPIDSDNKFVYISGIMLLCQMLLSAKQWFVHWAPASDLKATMFLVGPIIQDMSSFLPLYSSLFLSINIMEAALPWGLFRRVKEKWFKSQNSVPVPNVTPVEVMSTRARGHLPRAPPPSPMMMC